jgi:DNA-binding Lrp family transcriptional regulator
MITAIVFIEADVSQITDVAAALADIEGVSEVYSVTGELDLVAMVRVRDIDDVATVVADRVNKVEGVLATQTQIAYRVHSRHDLEDAFSIGL